MKMESKQLGTISVELETPRYWLPCLHLQQKLATSILLSLTPTPVVRQRLLDGHLSDGWMGGWMDGWSGSIRKHVFIMSKQIIITGEI